MNNLSKFPEETAVYSKIAKLIKIKEKRLLSERMSSRMVKLASALGQKGFIGWQMIVPRKGLINVSIFGSKAFCKNDLSWAVEKNAKLSKKNTQQDIDESLKELYEVYLPIAESNGGEATIGFGNLKQEKSGGTFGEWPSYFPGQFEELLKVLQERGAVLRVVVGYADETEQLSCRSRTLHTYDIKGTDVKEYIGYPVKIRILLRIAAIPSVRLKSVLDDEVPGAKLRYIGNIVTKKAAELWNNPLKDAMVVPDYAARIMIMEPESRNAVIGIETCEEQVNKIPASHKNTKDKGAVEIGKAMDTTGIRRRITIGERDLRRHYQIVGQTGTGKSTLLTTIILSAIEQGHGITFFDPHGSTIDAVLKSVPEKYAEKIRVVRIGDVEHPVPLNIWDSDDPMKEERNISDLCELFGDIFDPKKEGVVGPRYERWLSTFAKASIALLGRRASLESITVISQSQDNMLKLAKIIINKYPELVETIKQEYGLDKSSDFHNMLGWFLAKFQRLTSIEQLRKTLGAGANALDFEHTIDSDKVTLIDLASPEIGTHAARIVGTLIMMKLWNAAMKRKEREKTHLVIVDEASLFQTNPMPKMLAESRKFGISMVLSHQHTGQLSSEIRDALEANSANFSAFRLSARDAATAAVRFDDQEMSVQLTRLDAFNAITTLSVDGQQTLPFTLEIDRPKEQKEGERIAKLIEQNSIRELVEPYHNLRALTSKEILGILDNPVMLRCYCGTGRIGDGTRSEFGSNVPRMEPNKKLGTESDSVPRVAPIKAVGTVTCKVPSKVPGIELSKAASPKPGTVPGKASDAEPSSATNKGNTSYHENPDDLYDDGECYINEDEEISNGQEYDGENKFPKWLRKWLDYLKNRQRRDESD